MSLEHGLILFLNAWALISEYKFYLAYFFCLRIPLCCAMYVGDYFKGFWLFWDIELFWSVAYYL